MPTLPLAHALGYRLMSSFSGLEAPAEVLAEIKRRALGGFTLFRHLNVVDPAQVRRLTAGLQRAARAAGEPPLLIAADQEGGQLVAIAGTTPFAGNMALGAAGSTDLARRTGEAMGRELAALGINVNYAPVCDVNTNPLNPVVGTRAFGSDPARVASLTAALIQGLQAAGVAATAKHFPGHGDTAVDSHDALPVVRHDRQRLDAVELVPFRAAVAAGAKLVMTAHIAVPAATGQPGLPATLSPKVLRDLLRGELGFEGVSISDAMEMAAIEQGPRLGAAAAAAAAAGVDLLLLNANRADQDLIAGGLLESAQRKAISGKDLQASAQRVLALKAWCAQTSQPALDVVGGAEHRALAAEIAAASVTLVRDRAGRLPLKLSQRARLLLVRPELHNLTPADTTSYESLTLADALRAYHPRTEEVVVPINPSENDIAGVRSRAAGCDLVIAATINAQHHPGQAALVNALLNDDLAVVAVALRLPYDLVAYPAAPTYICTYSLLPPSIHALAQALWGEMSFGGKLPVTLPKGVL